MDGATMYIQLVAGFVLLLGGADILVRAAAALAARLSISSLAVGMTVVAFGTSAPELMVTLDAALSGAPDIGVGNIVGSNIANLLLIIGVSAVICPIVMSQPLRHDSVVLVAVTVLFTALALTGVLAWWAGAILAASLALFLVVAGRREQRRRRIDSPVKSSDERGDHGSAAATGPAGRGWRIGLGIAAGLAGVVFGADQLVKGSVAFARAAGVSEAVIGLTLIAIGTSLPELAASVAAAIRRHSEISIGNVIGSNIFNMLCVGGLTALVVPLPVAEQIRGFDLWIMLAATAVLFPFLFAGRRVGRVVGIVFVLLYAGYVTFLVGIGAAPATAPPM